MRPLSLSLSLCLPLFVSASLVLPFCANIFYQFATKNCWMLRKARTLWLHLHSLGFSDRLRHVQLCLSIPLSSALQFLLLCATLLLSPSPPWRWFSCARCVVLPRKPIRMAQALPPSRSLFPSLSSPLSSVSLSLLLSHPLSICCLIYAFLYVANVQTRRSSQPQPEGQLSHKQWKKRGKREKEGI